MDTHIADDKLKELHVEDLTVRANDRKAEAFEIDPVAEKKLLRKLDYRVVPVLWFLYLLSFLDRTNIGNASIQGMTADLDMEEGNSYNIALFIFFVPYILFELPSNLLLKKMAPSTWLSGIMFCWGIVTIGQGLVKSKEGLIACRFLLGLFESGFFPGCTYLISMYYRRYELQWRYNIFFTGAILAGSFSGLMAYGIAHMDGAAGYAGWRWIFIIEGALTAVFAILGKFFIVDWPETAKFLTDDEKRLLIARLSADVADSKMNTLDLRARKRIFTDWKMYLGVLMYFGIVNTGYATSFFTPTILTGMGYSPIEAQVHSIPIFIVAAFVCVCVAWLTDFFRHRYAFCMIGICVSTCGFVMLLNQSRIPVGAQYAAIFLIVCGGYTCQPITITWINNNMGGHYKRAVSSAMMIGFGNAGGIVASNIFLTQEAPGYKTGYGTSLGLLWLCGICCTVYLFGVMRENRKRERGEREYRLEEPDAGNQGDDDHRFRYTY
ncbi:uncharacterized protein LTR77_003112 [Saxophila tyrrhenica]|uniref:Major facilitator superfamily (MFS) profile domain-containing protein n=1 Tax=Saxophila tyrrhenica TaxID=1690608 RepID=A0AAV9PHC5_9PEZI|nr:hypothetical protein LTR77_003112 [Saxophila tyrrhenica]